MDRRLSQKQQPPALSAEEIAELKEEMNNPEVAVAPPKALVDLQPPILQKFPLRQRLP
ncbi:MAG: hypothetical protein IPG53_16195 [Ignavibacteriales bacterium]|nr:hypothetical protein [Ignavibacteriales bacterium]